MDGLKVNGPRAPEPKTPDAPAAGGQAPDSHPADAGAVQKAPPTVTRPGAGARRSFRPAGRGYSRFVSMAKFGLAGSALALVALLAAWPTLKEIPQPRIGVERGQPEISRPRFISSDDANQPYSVTATRAQELTDQPNIVSLEQPEAEMTENTGAWVTLRGDRGWYDRKTGILKMNGHVRILRDDGSELRTEEAFMLVRDGTAWGDVYTEGQGPQGEIKAQGFRMKDRGKTMTFLNGTNANVTPMATAGEPPAAQPAVAPVPHTVAEPAQPTTPAEPPAAAVIPASAAPTPAPAPTPASVPAPAVSVPPPAAAAAPAEPPPPAVAAGVAGAAAAAAVSAATPALPASVAVPPPPPPKPAVRVVPASAAKPPAKAAAPAVVKKPRQPAPAKPAAKPKRKP